MDTDMNLSQTLDIFKLLTGTYPRYVDTASREAVEAVGMELVKRDELRGTAEGDLEENKLGVTEQILGWLANEVGRISKRGVSGYVSELFCSKLKPQVDVFPVPMLPQIYLSSSAGLVVYTKYVSRPTLTSRQRRSGGYLWASWPRFSTCYRTILPLPNHRCEKAL